MAAVGAAFEQGIAFDESALAELKASFSGAHRAGRRRVRAGPAGLQRHDRQVSPSDRPLCGCRRRDRRRELRPRQRSAAGRARAAATTAAGLGVCDDGIVLDLSLMNGIRVDPDARTIRAEGGCTQGAVNHAGGRLRPGGAGRSRIHDRHRRPDPGRRPRLSRPEVRPGHRQPSGGGRRAGRRPARHRLGPAERGPLLGPPRRRRQLRRRHQLPVPGPARRRGHRRPDALGLRADRRDDALVSTSSCRRPRRTCTASSPS